MENKGFEGGETQPESSSSNLSLGMNGILKKADVQENTNQTSESTLKVIGEDEPDGGTKKVDGSKSDNTNHPKKQISFNFHGKEEENEHSIENEDPESSGQFLERFISLLSDKTLLFISIILYFYSNQRKLL